MVRIITGTFVILLILSSWATPTSGAPWQSNSQHKLEWQTLTEDIHGPGYSIFASPPTASFTETGKIMPARGLAHLSSQFDLKQAYVKANLILAYITYYHNNYMMAYNMPLPEPDHPPRGYPQILPPGPEEYIQKAPPPGWSHDRELTGSQAYLAWYHVDDDLRGKITGAFHSWKTSDSAATGATTFADYLHNQKPLLYQISRYLQEHNGPYPHHDYSDYSAPYARNYTVLSLDNFYPFASASLLKRAANLRLHAAALWDLTSDLGDSAMTLSQFYHVDVAELPVDTLDALSYETADTLNRRFTEEQRKCLLDSPYEDCRMISNHIPPHRGDHRGGERIKRFIAPAFMLTTVLNTVRTIQGIYTATELSRLKTKHEALNVLVETNTKSINSIQKRIETLILQGRSNGFETRFNKALIFLASQMSELEFEVSRSHNLLSSIPSGRPAGAFVAAYQLQQDVAKLDALARAQGTQLLLKSYSDLIQCPTSFIMEGSLLTVMLHINTGNPSDDLILYSFNPFPFNIDHNLVAEIDTRGHLLAVNDKLTRFTSLSPSDLQECARHGEYHTCLKGSILRTYDPDQELSTDNALQFSGKDPALCLFAIRVQRTDIIGKVCDLLISTPQTKVTRVSPSTFRVATLVHGRATINCNGKSHKASVSGTFDITLDPGCTAELDPMGFLMTAGDATLTQSNRSVQVPTSWKPEDIFPIADLRQWAESAQGPTDQVVVIPTTLTELTKAKETSDKIMSMNTHQMASIISWSLTLLAAILVSAGGYYRWQQIRPLVSMAIAAAAPRLAPHLDELDRHINTAHQQQQQQQQRNPDGLDPPMPAPRVSTLNPAHLLGHISELISHSLRDRASRAGQPQDPRADHGRAVTETQNRPLNSDSDIQLAPV